MCSRLTLIDLAFSRPFQIGKALMLLVVLVCCVIPTKCQSFSSRLALMNCWLWGNAKNRYYPCLQPDIWTLTSNFPCFKALRTEEGLVVVSQPPPHAFFLSFACQPLELQVLIGGLITCCIWACCTPTNLAYIQHSLLLSSLIPSPLSISRQPYSH